MNTKDSNKMGPIAEQSNWLDRGRGDPSLNPGKGYYGNGELSIICIDDYSPQPQVWI